MTKLKIILSAIGAFIVSALSATCYVLFHQKKEEARRADEAEKLNNELKKQVEVQDEFNQIQREADEKANEKHVVIDNPDTPTSGVLQDLYNNSKNRVRCNK